VRRGWASPAGQVALVGRDAELERLAAAAAAAVAGQGKIVLISGEPGIGKTAILTWLVDRAAAAGARIASGAAEELEMRVPFAAVSDCLGLSVAATDPKAAEIAARAQRAPASGRRVLRGRRRVPRHRGDPGAGRWLVRGAPRHAGRR
jgi:predicted ATPase